MNEEKNAQEETLINYIIRHLEPGARHLRRQSARRRKKDSPGSKRFRAKRKSKRHGPRRQWVGKR